MTDHPYSPMLVQYLVALCCQKWEPDAVDVVVGDMVHDEVGDIDRDIDVTVTVREGGALTHAFKAYEVKREAKPLDIATVEQLCAKMGDMPSLTHRAIVSSSGFSAGAITKAAKKGVALYQLKPWAGDMRKNFPLFDVDGSPQDFFRTSELLLCWPSRFFSIVARSAPGPFEIAPGDALFTAKGRKHKRFPTFADYTDALLWRSTDLLFATQMPEHMRVHAPVPLGAHANGYTSGPSWPHTHTLDVSADAVFVRIGEMLCRLDMVSISGKLQWQRYDHQFQFQVLEEVSSGEVFAAAVVSPERRLGRVCCILLSPGTREIGIRFVELSPRHRNAIRKLKLSYP